MSIASRDVASRVRTDPEVSKAIRESGKRIGEVAVLVTEALADLAEAAAIAASVINGVGQAVRHGRKGDLDD